MALPLPKVVADVGPGGPLVTAMGGMNSLANDMLLRKINEVKAKYAPLTTQAEAASKLAYANLMGPQFLAKLMANPGFMANSSEEQKKAYRDAVSNAGTGQGTGNALTGLPGFDQAVGAGDSDSFSGWLKNSFKNLTGNTFGGGNPTAPSSNALNAAPPTQPNPRVQQVPDEQQQIIQENASNLAEWSKSPEGLAAIKQAHDTGQNVPIPTPDELSRWRRQQGMRPPTEMTLTKTQQPTQSYQTPEHDQTWSEKTGEQQGIEAQGTESGKLRAKDVNNLGEQQQRLSESGATLDRAIQIIKDPEFQKMRKDIPFFQDKQLSVLSKIGTPEQQRLIGDFLSTAEAFKASTVNSFKGKALEKEFNLADKIKVSENDTIPVAEGKLRALKTLKEIAEAKNGIVLDLMQTKHMNLGDATRRANKQVDIRAIEKEVGNLINPKATEEDIKHMAEKYKKSPDEIRKLLKAQGNL